MNPTALKELVALRQSMCVTGHISIDTINGIAKGYTKAKNCQDPKFSGINHPNVKNQEADRLTHPELTSRHTEQLSGIFKYLDIDYVGGAK